MVYNKYTKKLQKKIKKLNLDYEDTGGLLVYLYLYGGCPEEDCAKLFNFTVDSIIDYLKYEHIYGYKICNCCEKLKERNEIEFKRRKDTKNTNICTECKKLKDKQYRQDSFTYLQNQLKIYYLKNKEKIKNQQNIYYLEHKKERNIYYLNNKKVRQEYMKNYQKENKEILREKQKLYNLENKENRKEYIKKYYGENKEILKEKQKLYNLENKEKIQENRKIYRNSPANKELVKKLELYEEVKENQIKCRYCGDWYTPTITEVYNRLKGISNNDTCYIYCSEECKEACPIFNKQLYPKGFKPATSREVNPVLRQLVFERDQYTCQKCFKHKDKLNCPLHCHHIIPYVDNPIEDGDVNNSITLCKDCHKEVHQIPGCRYNELKCG